MATNPPGSAWSTSSWVRFAPADSGGERAVIVDTPGGELDRLLSDPDVATVLNDRFAPIFLHPTSVPAFTARVGWPSLTVLDPDGCLRLHSDAPPDAAALVERINEALRRREAGTGAPWPAPVPAPRAEARWASPSPRLQCREDLPPPPPDASVSPLRLPVGPDVVKVPTER